ncbi:putative membrane protein [Aureibacter tunicatorum]|uniref:Membrane protein n=1 Tax=Aureibacter tunicatorum TaxID=866807 RepID=A0AAE3XMS7_9BACT|nr:putative membrane protein [Aureibacter tunicatorum]BDD05286.1 hypothetical protein AUTU_27690 [Aureibacter tunicatorum]
MLKKLIQSFIITSLILITIVIGGITGVPLLSEILFFFFAVPFGLTYADNDYSFLASLSYLFPLALWFVIFLIISNKRKV